MGDTTATDFEGITLAEQLDAARHRVSETDWNAISEDGIMYGTSQGWWGAAHHLREQAVKAFIAGEDDKARLLRGLVFDLKAEAGKLEEEWRYKEVPESEYKGVAR